MSLSDSKFLHSKETETSQIEDKTTTTGNQVNLFQIDLLILQDMEAEVNLYYDELFTAKSHDYLLSNQLQRLLMCFDVFLETKGEGEGAEGPSEFAREKMFIRLARYYH